LKRVTPKKHLGQHFLKDRNIAKKIVDSINTEKENLIIEIGPGTGILTDLLIDQPLFEAYDVDKESVEFLKEKYGENGSKVYLKDFLTEDLNQKNAVINVIGNFPYNISSQIFFRIYDYRNHVEQVVCMIQKEVAERIVSKEGNKTYGILSVLLKAFYEIEYLFTVKPGVFIPPPKVNSAVIRLSRNKTKKLACNEILFKKVVKAGFNQRRKTLRNSLKTLALPESLKNHEYLNKRAEQLSVGQFVELTKMIEEHAGD